MLNYEFANENNTDVLLSSLSALLAEKKSVILAIDGHCGAGKTTLAYYLANKLNGTIISMDDFFLPFNLRTDKRLEEPGGNIHYERFEEEIIKPLSRNKTSPFSYHKFQCSNGTLTQPITITPTSLIIIEGSYSMHPLFQHLYDCSVFVTCSPVIQEERILKRNGKQALNTFKERWIPMENKYFSAFDIKKSCSHILETGF